MSDQFGRRCSLIVGDAAGNGLELSNLRVVFAVNKADTQSPAHAIIRIYNPNDETARTVQKEFVHVFLQAGYEDNFGLIFSGAIRQARRGRENPTDTYLELVAQDGDEGYNFAVANTTLARGWDQTALHGALMQSFGEFDLAAGYVPTFGGPPMPRAKVCYGMTRDYMRTLADSAGTSWHIADGKINLVPIASTLPGEAVVLTRKTGLIGMPQQTLNGITCRSLLNPRIRFGGQIKLDNASIQQAQISVAYSAVNYFPGLDDDGFYKVYAISLHGDTRGQEWYSDLICAAVDGTAPITGPYINATASSTGY
jgi:hypothetical protein